MVDEIFTEGCVLEIRLLMREELNSALDLVWKVFCEYEASNYTEDARQVFYDAIHSKEYLDSLTAYGAFHGDEIVGIIAGRNEGSHIALFFVDGEYQKQGIGRKLWETLLETSNADIITVHSSIYVCEIYGRLGFKQTDGKMEDGGIVYVPMEYLHFMDMIQDKNDDAAYAEAKRIAAASEFSDEYCRYIPEFVEMLSHKKSYMRSRAMILICSQARWDESGAIAEYLPQILKLLHDEKPTVVRQSLNALKEIAVFRPELCKVIMEELEKINLSKYRESMAGLIQKDIDELQDVIRQVV